MTGDNYYPSARSAIHRLSGHFEKNIRSTQNQMISSLNKRCDIIIEDATITMHHWPLNGFAEWDKENGLKNFKLRGLPLEEQDRYHTEYKNIQQEILQLERYLIHDLQEKYGDNCFNKKIKKKPPTPQPKFNEVIAEMRKVVEYGKSNTIAPN
jgi:hypothetical protein